MDAAERYRLYTQVSAPLGLFSCIVCGIAVITSYIYPSQRKFPNVVLVWTCIGDCALASYTSIKWLPGPVREYFTDQVIDRSVCIFSIYFQWVMLEAAAMLSLLLAFTLYVTIVKRVDMAEVREKYYYPYLAIVWIPTLLVPLFCLVDTKNLIVDAGLCKMTSPKTIIFRTSNLLLPLAIQILLMGRVFKEVFTVTRAVRENSTNNISSTKALLWLGIFAARFFGAQVNEFIIWLPIMHWDLLNMEKVAVPRSLIMFTVFGPGFLSINGFIVLAGNKSLKMSLRRIYLSLRGRFSRAKSIQDQPIMLATSTSYNSKGSNSV